MSTQQVVLILGLVAIFATLFGFQIYRGGGGKATVSLTNLFSISLSVDARSVAVSDQAVREAAKARGKVVPEAPSPGVKGESTTLARILWVDDRPDGNVYETIALEALGRFVTKATGTDAALTYMENLDFSLVITDIGRPEGAEAGIDFIRLAKAHGHRIPFVVYTSDRDATRTTAISAGASSVVDTPSDLIRAVQSQLD